MPTLGYIVSDRKLSNIKNFIKQVDDISKADLSKPTLIVGLDMAKAVKTEGFSILQKKIDENLFWTFKKTERRTDYEKDIINFYNYIINYNLNNIKYYYINIINLKYNNLKKLINYIFSNQKKYIFISNNGMLYVLHDKIVLGLSLEIMRYIGINTCRILDRLRSNENNVICDDVSGCLKDIRIEVGNNRYIIPYLMSID